MNPFVAQSVCHQRIKQAMSKAEVERVNKEFDRRLNKKMPSPYSAVPIKNDEALRLQHIPGLPFARVPVPLIQWYASNVMGIKPGEVFAPEKGDGVSALGTGLAGLFTGIKEKDFTPAQRKVFTDIIKAHELDEVHTTPARAMMTHNHNSPEVILREHNRVVSLGEDMAPVRDAFVKLRKTKPLFSLRRLAQGKREDRVLQKADPDFVYGEGAPLSEEKKREMVEALERREQRKQDLASLGWGAAAAGGLGFGLYKLLKKGLK